MVGAGDGGWPMSANLKALLKPAHTSDWHTPRALYRELDKEFGFTMDPCKPGDFGGLQARWHGVVWCNPPYGRTIGKWIARGWSAAREGGATVVMLLPSRTDTSWWHDYCMTGEIRFIRGRLRFGDAKNSAPFPSVIVIFRPGVRP